MHGEMDYQSMFTFMLEMAGTIAFAASELWWGAQREWIFSGSAFLEW